MQLVLQGSSLPGTIDMHKEGAAFVIAGKAPGNTIGQHHLRLSTVQHHAITADPEHRGKSLQWAPKSQQGQKSENLKAGRTKTARCSVLC